jgi:hypothetical protein
MAECHRNEGKGVEHLSDRTIPDANLKGIGRKMRTAIRQAYAAYPDNGGGKLLGLSRGPSVEVLAGREICFSQAAYEEVARENIFGQSLSEDPYPQVVPPEVPSYTL